MCQSKLPYFALTLLKRINKMKDKDIKLEVTLTVVKNIGNEK